MKLDFLRGSMSIGKLIPNFSPIRHNSTILKHYSDQFEGNKNRHNHSSCNDQIEIIKQNYFKFTLEL